MDSTCGTYSQNDDHLHEATLVVRRLLTMHEVQKVVTHKSCETSRQAACKVPSLLQGETNLEPVLEAVLGERIDELYCWKLGMLSLLR